MRGLPIVTKRQMTALAPSPGISRWLHLPPAVIAALFVLSAVLVVASSCGGATFSPLAVIAGHDERAVPTLHAVIDGRNAQCVLCEWNACASREAVLAASPGVAVQPKASHPTARGIATPLPPPRAPPPRASAITVTFDPRGPPSAGRGRPERSEEIASPVGVRVGATTVVFEAAPDCSPS